MKSTLPSPLTSAGANPIQLWSACPSPLDRNLQLDIPAVQRMVEWHVSHGIKGLMVLGTCGEGPWLPDRHRRQLIEEAVRAASGRIRISAQVSDNSSARVLEQIESAAEAGADYAVVAQPYFSLKAKATDLARFYHDIADRSPLPLGFYDRGKSATVPVPNTLLADIVSHPGFKFVKDSSGDLERSQIYLSVKANRPDWLLMTGNEFKVVDYLSQGYDGLLLGGMVVSARYVRATVAAFFSGDLARAQTCDQQMQTMLRTLYGGPSISCWLAGLKHLLVRLGVFACTANHLGYELTPECKAAVESLLASPEALFAVGTTSVGIH